MKTILSKWVLLLALLPLLGANSAPPGMRSALSGGTREINGYSVKVPGKGWWENTAGGSVLFVKRIDATESYHAGMTVTSVPTITSKADFEAFTDHTTKGQAANPRYKIVRNEMSADEANGLWIMRGRMDFEDSGAVNVGKHATLATHGAHFFALDPQEPQQVVRVWFSWRSAKFDDAKFTKDAEHFFASFRRNAPK